MLYHRAHGAAETRRTVGAIGRRSLTLHGAGGFGIPLRGRFHVDADRGLGGHRGRAYPAGLSHGRRGRHRPAGGGGAAVSERDPIEQLMMTDEERERDHQDADAHNDFMRERLGVVNHVPPGERTIKALHDRGRVIE